MTKRKSICPSCSHFHQSGIRVNDGKTSPVYICSSKSIILDNTIVSSCNTFRSIPILT